MSKDDTQRIRLREVSPDDTEALWDILEPTFRRGDTYTIDPMISKQEAIAYWTSSDKSTFLARLHEKDVGTYYIRPNQSGRGNHVCNCGFITHPKARGLGVARQMLEHALKKAKATGYHAMQFNFVVSTNTRAVDIWKTYGFDIVGTLPEAFDHPALGLVDAYVMYKTL